MCRLKEDMTHVLLFYFYFLFLVWGGGGGDEANNLIRNYCFDSPSATLDVNNAAWMLSSHRFGLPNHS